MSCNKQLRSLIRNLLQEILNSDDVELSKKQIRHDVHSSGMGQPILVQLGNKKWLTSSQQEIDRVLKLGGFIVKNNNK